MTNRAVPELFVGLLPELAKACTPTACGPSVPERTKINDASLAPKGIHEAAVIVPIHVKQIGGHPIRTARCAQGQDDQGAEIFGGDVGEHGPKISLPVDEFLKTDFDRVG